MAKPSSWAQVAFKYGTDRNTNQLNVLWYAVTGTTSEANDQDAANSICTDVWTALNVLFGNCMSDETVLHGVSCRYSKVGNIWDGVFDSGDSANGTNVGDTFPEFVAAVVQKRTNHPGRGGRGRFFIGCIAEGECDNGRVGDDLFDQLGLLGVGLTTVVTSSGLTLTPQLYSQKDDTMYPLTVCKVDRELGSMRRRKVKPLF